MFSGREAKSYLGEIITALDNGQTPARPTSPWWVRHMAVPTALGISLGLTSCVNDPSAPQVSKDEAIQAKADGWTSDLCTSIGEEPGCDICDAMGWYGDGACDDFCDEPDTIDCGATALYAAPPAEICDDGFDNDSDGRFDCDDTDCSADPACQPTARYMAPMAEDCDDGADNDRDGDVDCDDSDCSADPACQPTARYMAPMAEVCDDGVDNDNDGDIDCEDSECYGNCACRPTPRYMAPMENCTDGVDNNCDGLVDCDDEGCADDPACAPTPARYMAPFGK